jgi:hypothetical protein
MSFNDVDWPPEYFLKGKLSYDGILLRNNVRTLSEKSAKYFIGSVIFLDFQEYIIPGFKIYDSWIESKRAFYASSFVEIYLFGIKGICPYADK